MENGNQRVSTPEDDQLSIGKKTGMLQVAAASPPAVTVTTWALGTPCTLQVSWRYLAPKFRRRVPPPSTKPARYGYPSSTL